MNTQTTETLTPETTSPTNAVLRHELGQVVFWLTERADQCARDVVFCAASTDARVKQLRAVFSRQELAYRRVCEAAEAMISKEAQVAESDAALIGQPAAADSPATQAAAAPVRAPTDFRANRYVDARGRVWRL